MVWWTRTVNTLNMVWWLKHGLMTEYSHAKHQPAGLVNDSHSCQTRCCNSHREHFSKYHFNEYHYTSHTKIMLPTCKSEPRSSRQSDHTKISLRTQRDANCSGMVMSTVHQVLPKPSCRHYERREKTRQTEEVGRQHQGMDRPWVRQVPECTGEQRKMEKTGCEVVVPQWSSRLSLFSWCFQPSQPQRITSWLKTNLGLSPSHSWSKL